MVAKRMGPDSIFLNQQQPQPSSATAWMDPRDYAAIQQAAAGSAPPNLDALLLARAMMQQPVNAIVNTDPEPPTLANGWGPGQTPASPDQDQNSPAYRYSDTPSQGPKGGLKHALGSFLTGMMQGAAQPYRAQEAAIEDTRARIEWMRAQQSNLQSESAYREAQAQLMRNAPVKPAETVTTQDGVFQWDPQSQRYSIPIGPARTAQRNPIIHETDQGIFLIDPVTQKATPLTYNGTQLKPKPQSASFEEQSFQEWHQAHPKGTRLQFEKERAAATRQNTAITPGADVPLISPKKQPNLFRIAQDLAYGRMTLQTFRSVYAYSRDAQAKQSLYATAQSLNPNFNPASFEMGYTLAKNPKVQQQLASLDNVIQAAPDLVDVSNRASRTGIKSLNAIVMKGGIQFGGKTYSNFHTAQIAFADELSGALGYGSATDMSREMGFNMTDANLSPEAFASAINEIVLPFVQRKRATLLNQMGIYGQSDMNPAANAPKPGQPQGSSNGGIKILRDANGRITGVE
jgi:hypothetical protein